MRQVGAETRPGVFHNFTRPSRVAQVKIAVIGQNVRGGRATDPHRGPDTNGQEEWEPIWPNNEGVKVKGEGRAMKEGRESGEQINLTILRFKNMTGWGARERTPTGRFPESVKTARAHAKKGRGRSAFHITCRRIS